MGPKATCIPWAETNLIRYPRSLWSSSLSRLPHATRGSMTLLPIVMENPSQRLTTARLHCNCRNPVMGTILLWHFDIARYCYVVIVISSLDWQGWQSSYTISPSFHEQPSNCTFLSALDIVNLNGYLTRGKRNGRFTARSPLGLFVNSSFI